jgi:hypothetical protein
VDKIRGFKIGMVFVIVCMSFGIAGATIGYILSYLFFGSSKMWFTSAICMATILIGMRLVTYLMSKKP